MDAMQKLINWSKAGQIVEFLRQRRLRRAQGSGSESLQTSSSWVQPPFSCFNAYENKLTLVIDY